MRVAHLATLLCFTASPLLAQAVSDGAPNRPDLQPAFPEQTEAPAQVTDPAPEMTELASGLTTPWGIAVLPGDLGYLVTERGGTLRHVSRDGEVSSPLSGVPEVRAQRQGGLLDVEVSSDFGESRRVLLTYSRPVSLGRSATAAASFVLSEDLTALTEPIDLFEQTPPSVAPGHFGSRIVELPDGSFAVTTGDRFTGDDLAQDASTSYGAVVRVLPDGTPVGEGFGTGALPELYSHGHRNVQGAAVHPETGQLWTIEHGPAGGDELNIIRAGGNYGWPLVSYGENYNGSPINGGRSLHAPEFVPPRYYWDPVIAPGGMVFYDGEMFPEWQGNLLAAGLVAQAVVRLELDGETVVGEERLAEGVGRVRDVAVDHDGAVLFLTDAGESSSIMRLAR